MVVTTKFYSLVTPLLLDHLGVAWPQLVLKHNFIP